MGQMMGSFHAAMNAMMIQTHGEQGEEQIHIAMGKRLSGCDTSATIPFQSSGWMQMMWGGWSSPFGFNSTNNMMNFGYGFWFLRLDFYGFVVGSDCRCRCCFSEMISRSVQEWWDFKQKCFGYSQRTLR